MFFVFLIISVLKKIHLHEFVQVTVQHTLCVGGFKSCADILDKPEGLKSVVADLAAPLNLLFLTFQLGLLLLALLEFKVIQM